MALANSSTTVLQRIDSVDAVPDTAAGLSVFCWGRTANTATSGASDRALWAMINENTFGSGWFVGIHSNNGAGGLDGIVCLDLTGFAYNYAGTFEHDDNVWVSTALRVSTTGQVRMSTRRISETDITHGTEGPTRTLPTGLSALNVGGNSWAANENWRGEWDNFILYEGVLSDSEFNQQTKQRFPVDWAKLHTWLPMVDLTSLATQMEDRGPGAAADWAEYGSPTIVAGVDIPWAPENTLSANVGQALATGQKATLLLAQQLACFIGAAIATGRTVTLTQQLQLKASIGAAVAAGLPASLGRRLSAGLAQAVAQGADVQFNRAALLNAFRAEAIAAGLQAELRLARTLALESGAATAQGRPAALARVAPMQPAAASATGHPALLGRSLSARKAEAQAQALEAATARALAAKTGQATAAGAPSGFARAMPFTPAAAEAEGLLATLRRATSLSTGVAVATTNAAALARALPLATAAAEATGQPATFVQANVLFCKTAHAIAEGKTMVINGNLTLRVGLAEALATPARAGLAQSVDLALEQALASPAPAALRRTLACRLGRATATGWPIPVEEPDAPTGGGHYKPVRDRRVPIR